MADPQKSNFSGLLNSLKKWLYRLLFGIESFENHYYKHLQN
jgi:hypothetical protein